MAMSLSLLSPRVHQVLTCGGSAVDGAGVLRRLENEIRRRAHEEWQRTGNPDPRHNWAEAERQVIRHLSQNLPHLPGIVEEDEDLGSPKGSQLSAEHFKVERAEGRGESLPAARQEEGVLGSLACHEPTAQVQQLQALVNALRSEAVTREARLESELDNMRKKCSEQDAALQHLAKLRVQGGGALAGACGGGAASDLPMKLRWLKEELASTDRLLQKRSLRLEELEVLAKNRHGELTRRSRELEVARAEVEYLSKQCSQQELELQAFRSNQAVPATVGSSQVPAPPLLQQALNRITQLEKELQDTETLLASNNSRCRQLEIASASARKDLALKEEELKAKSAELAEARHLAASKTAPRLMFIQEQTKGIWLGVKKRASA